MRFDFFLSGIRPTVPTRPRAIYDTWIGGTSRAVVANFMPTEGGRAANALGGLEVIIVTSAGPAGKFDRFFSSS